MEKQAGLNKQGCQANVGGPEFLAATEGEKKWRRPRRQNQGGRWEARVGHVIGKVMAVRQSPGHKTERM